jgi:hypothetical protein
LSAVNKHLCERLLTPSTQKEKETDSLALTLKVRPLRLSILALLILIGGYGF